MIDTRHIFYVIVVLLFLLPGAREGYAGSNAKVERCPFDGYQIQGDRYVEHVHNGKKYKFCTNFCVRLFEKDPAKYLAAPDADQRVLDLKPSSMDERKSPKTVSANRFAREDLPKSRAELDQEIRELEQDVLRARFFRDQPDLSRDEMKIEQDDFTEQSWQEHFANDNRKKLVNPAAFSPATFVLTSQDQTLQVPLKQFETSLDVEYFDYVYKEPSLGVKDTGSFFGIEGDMTYRVDPRPENPDSLEQDDFLWAYHLGGRFYNGEIDYTGSATINGIRDYGFELRGLAGAEYVNYGMLINPYTGLGWRRHYDEFGEAAATPTIASGYDRRSTYWYLPLGVTLKKFINSWSFALNLEYDWMFKGQQISHLEQSRLFDGSDPGWPKVENEQKNGFGYQISLRIAKETGRFDFYIEPFFRLWEIEQSELYNDGFIAGYEPENITRELGVKLGMMF